MLNQRRKDPYSTLRGPAASRVSFALDGTAGATMGRQSSVAPLSPSSTSTAPPMLGQTSMMGSSRFFGVSARGAKLTRPLSTTADLGVVFTGFLDKISPGLTPLQSPPRKRRFLVLTNTALRWYKRTDGDELFGDHVGGVPLKDILRISLLDDLTFELAAADRRRRVFVAATQDERDLWVGYISEGMKKQLALCLQGAAPAAAAGDSAPSSAGSSSSSSLGSPSSAPTGPQVELVLHKDGKSLSETVRAHDLPYGATLRLGGVEVEDLIMVQLTHGAGYIPLEGAALKERISHPEGSRPFKVMVSSGEGHAWVKALPSAQPEGAWFQEKQVLEAWVVALFALYSFNPLSLLVLAYIAHQLYHLWYRAHQAVGAVDLVIEGYEPMVDESAAQRASKQMTIPPKFIDGCQGDMVEARRRWDITRSWREEYDVDNILSKPHPKFEIIKKHWPHFFLPHAKNGDPVYVERTGEFNMPAMLAEGVGIDELLHHCVWSSEFMYQHICKDAHREKLVTVYDLAGANLGDLKGEAKVFLRKGLGLVQQHYPERSRVIVIANAPIWFSLLWKILKSILNEATQKKVRVAASGSETLNAFKEFIDVENIPVEYGGKFDPSGSGQKDACRWHSPQEESMRKYVLEMNAKHPGESFPLVAPPYKG